MSAEKPTVLFLCADNSVRSQLAEALLRHRCRGRYDCRSAGLVPRPVHPLVETALREAGIATDGLVAKRIGPFLGQQAVRWAIILRTPEETGAPRIFPFATRTLRWEVGDPGCDALAPGEALDAVRRTRDEIDGCIASWLASVESTAPRTTAA